MELRKWNYSRTVLAQSFADLWTLGTEVGMISLYEPIHLCRSYPLGGQAVFLNSALGREAVSVA